MKIFKKITAVMTAAVLMFSVSAFPVTASELSDNSPVIVEENNPTIISEGDSLSVEEEAVAVAPDEDNTGVTGTSGEDNMEMSGASYNSEGDNQFRIYYYLSGEPCYEEDKSTSDTTFENIYNSLKFEIEETIETKITSGFVYDVKTVNYEEWLPSTSIQNLRVDIKKQFVATSYNITVKKVWDLERPLSIYVTDTEGFPIDFYRLEILDENDNVLEEIINDPENRDGLIIKTKEKYSADKQYFVKLYNHETEIYPEKFPIESPLCFIPDSITADVYSSVYGTLMGEVQLNSSNDWMQSFSTTIEPSYDMYVTENSDGLWDTSYDIEEDQYSPSSWVITITNKLKLGDEVCFVKVPVGQNIPDSGNPGLPVMVVLIFIGTSLFLGSYYIVTKKK